MLVRSAGDRARVQTTLLYSGRSYSPFNSPTPAPYTFIHPRHPLALPPSPLLSFSLSPINLNSLLRLKLSPGQGAPTPSKIHSLSLSFSLSLFLMVALPEHVTTLTYV